MLGYFRYNGNEYVRRHIVSYFFVVLVLVLGVVVGAYAVRVLPDEQKLELVTYFKLFFQGLNQEPVPGEYPELLLTVMLNNFKTILLMWLLGFTVIGIPLTVFLVFTRGFVIGFTVGFLVNEYVVKGLLFALASVLPHNFLAIPAVLVTAVSSISFSLMLARRRLRAKVNLVYEAMGYSLLCFLMVVLMVAASLVEVYISPVFMKLAAALF